MKYTKTVRRIIRSIEILKKKGMDIESGRLYYIHWLVLEGFEKTEARKMVDELFKLAR